MGIGSRKVVDASAPAVLNGLRRSGSGPSPSTTPAPSPRRASGRVGPIESMREPAIGDVRAGQLKSSDASRSGSFTRVIQTNARGIVSRLPTMKKLLGAVGVSGDGSGKRTGSHGLNQSSSNRRIRRRDFTFVPAEPTPEKLKKLRYIIMPRSVWKVRWDLWIGFIIAYSVIMIPYRIGFNVDLSSWEEALNYAFDASFATDVVFNFFTGYFDGDVFIYDLPKIRWRYLKSWFVFDMLSTLPMDNFFQSLTEMPASSDPSLLSFKLFRTIRLFRLLKLMRLLRLKRAVETIQMDALNAHVLQTVKSLMMIIFIIHLISCAWYTFYTWDPTGTNWVTFFNPNGIKNPYLVSFYWVANTMMSVGYGDIYGITDSERMFSIFVECVGSISVGLIIANIQMLTENYNPRGIIMKQKLHETKEFLLQRSIPRRLRQRVISQFEYHWSRRTVFDEDELLAHFPKSLQYEILAASTEPFVKKFPFFGMTSVDFFVHTIPRLRPVVVGLGQTLVEAESVWEEVYFIVSGSLDAMRGNVVASSLVSGDICGLEYLVGTRRRYVHSYIATGKTELFSIYSADLIEGMSLCSIATKYLTDLSNILAERYADAARRGRKTLQKQETSSLRRASIDLFLQYRHRKSPSHGSILQTASPTNAQLPLHLTVGEVAHLHWSIIHHYSHGRVLWDMIMAVIVAWTTISVPFRISFGISDTNFLKITDRLSDGMFFMDILFNFFTTYVDDTGVEVVDRHEIRKHYLKKSFVVDMISTIPFDFLVETITASGDFRSLKLIRTVKLVKLLRLMRIMKIFKINSQRLSELDISMDSVRLLKLLAPVLTIAHYVGCFWYYMSADHEAKEAWWGRIHFDNPDSITSRYIASVYWATTTMATVGFGDIYAVNSNEQLYSILVMIGGTTLFAYVVGTVIEVVSNSKSLANREHEMGQRINAYIKERGVSREFVTACQEHLRYLNCEKTLFFEQGLFSSLSHSLRSELIMHLNSNVLAHIRFFDKKPKWFLTLLLPRLMPQFFLQGDLMIYHGNLPSGIFFLMSGTAIARVPQPSTDEPENADGSPPIPTPLPSISVRKRTQQAISMTTNGKTTEAVPDRDGTIATLHEGEFFGYKEVLTRSLAQYNVFACVPTGTYVLPSEFLDFVREVYPGVLDEMRVLFLHSITKQQTILQHWHNNDIMGISGEECEQILRADGRVDSPLGTRMSNLSGRVKNLRALGGVHEESDMEVSETVSTPAPGHKVMPSVDHAQEMAVSIPLESSSASNSELVRPQPDEFEANAKLASHDHLIQPHADDTRQDALEVTGPDASLVVGSHHVLETSAPDSDREPYCPPQTGSPPKLARGGSLILKGSTTFEQAVGSQPSLRRNQSTRRSSVSVPRRPNAPPLLRFPSMPEEINALVGKLLEVEGYVSPATDQPSDNTPEPNAN